MLQVRSPCTSSRGTTPIASTSRATKVDPDEVEDVFYEQPLIRRTREGRYLALRRTNARRLLAVIFERRGRSIRVVTAHDMGAAERDY